MITLTIMGPVPGPSLLMFLAQEFGGANPDRFAVTQRLLRSRQSIHEYTVLAAPIYDSRSPLVREYYGMSPADELRT